MMNTDHDKCLACEGEDAAHTCEWTNQDCPARCSGEHPAPPIDETFYCANADEWWRYCYECGWERVYQYAPNPIWVNGRLLCDPRDHGYGYCDMCWEWVDGGDLHYSEVDGADYCSECFSPSPDWWGDGERRQRCDECGSYNDHMDLYTEAYLCDHRAGLAHVSGVPIRWASEGRRRAATMEAA